VVALAAMMRSSAPVQLRLILPHMTRLDLTEEEREELIEVLRDAIETDRYRLSPRVRRLRRLLEKLTSPPTQPTPQAQAERRRR
jgi:hypothetical protein